MFYIIITDDKTLKVIHGACLIPILKWQPHYIFFKEQKQYCINTCAILKINFHWKSQKFQDDLDDMQHLSAQLLLSNIIWTNAKNNYLLCPGILHVKLSKVCLIYYGLRGLYQLYPTNPKTCIQHTTKKSKVIHSQETEAIHFLMPLVSLLHFIISCHISGHLSSCSVKLQHLPSCCRINHCALTTKSKRFEERALLKPASRSRCCSCS